ncbi:MAG: PrsW family intramembrane metalloprotease [Clostridiales bacterium]|nr:PrsW family intramembrane metalloprotease [Clostridiales bacterium]
MTFLLVVSLLPAVVLCGYIYKKDRAEKEPIGLLLKLMLFGALIAIPVVFFELMTGSLIDAYFSDTITVTDDSVTYTDTTQFIIYTILKNFIGVALFEEGFKFLVLYRVTKYNENFNSLFDGIIYAVFVSLGFAAIENVGYVFSMGVETGFFRAFTSVPGHMFFGVFMGYYYSWYHIYVKAGYYEKTLRRYGVLPYTEPPFKSSNYLFGALAVPILVHGFYDFCLSLDSNMMVMIFFVFLLALYFICFRRINKMSKADFSDVNYAYSLLVKKYRGYENVIYDYFIQSGV